MKESENKPHVSETGGPRKNAVDILQSFRHGIRELNFYGRMEGHYKWAEDSVDSIISGINPGITLNQGQENLLLDSLTNFVSRHDNNKSPDAILNFATYINSCH